MARELGDAAFGVFTFALALVAVVTVLGDFGQGAVLTREVARDAGRTDRYFADTLALRTALALPALVVTLAVASLGGMADETRAVVALMGAAVVVELATSTCFSLYQARERLELIPIVLIPQRFLTAGAGIAALLLGAGVVTVAAIYLACAVVALAWAGWLLARRIARPSLRIRPATWRGLMRAAAPIGITSVFATVLLRVDTAMLAAYRSDAVVGDYGAAWRLVEATFFISWAIGAATYPVFSRLARPGAADVFARAVKLALAATLPFAVGAAVLARPVLDALYGSEFTDAAGALRLLAPVVALVPVAYLAGYLLISQGRPGAEAIAYGIVAVENVLANLVLIPLLSLEGAALSSSISQVLVTAILLALTHRLIAPVAWGRVLVGPVAAAALAAAVMWLARDTLAVAILAGGTTYVVALAALEVRLNPADVRAVLDRLPGRLERAMGRGRRV